MRPGQRWQGVGSLSLTHTHTHTQSLSLTHTYTHTWRQEGARVVMRPGQRWQGVGSLTRIHDSQLTCAGASHLTPSSPAPRVSTFT